MTERILSDLFYMKTFANKLKKRN